MKEQGVVRCKVCGRQLHNPISIARGIGPVCAGDQPTSRKTQVKVRSSSRRSYVDSAPSNQIFPPITAGLTAQDKLYRLITIPLALTEYRAELARMKRGTKKILRKMRAEMLQARRAFCAGAFLLYEEQCVFEPVDEKSWREVHSSRVLENSALQTYLMQIGVLMPERQAS